MTIQRKARVTDLRRKIVESGPGRGMMIDRALEVRLVVTKGPVGWVGQDVLAELTVSELVDLLPVASARLLFEALREKFDTYQEE